MSNNYIADGIITLRQALPSTLAGCGDDEIEILYHWWCEEFCFASWLMPGERETRCFEDWLTGARRPAGADK